VPVRACVLMLVLLLCATAIVWKEVHWHQLQDTSLEDVVRGSALPAAKKDQHVGELSGNGLDLTVAGWWGMSEEERKEMITPALRLYLQGVLKRTEAGVLTRRIPS
jgi:hypothetical protein